MGGDLEKDFTLFNKMNLGFNIAAVFKKVQAVVNHVSTEHTSSQDIGGSHSLLTLYNTLNQSFSSSNRFKQGYYLHLNS